MPETTTLPAATPSVSDMIGATAVFVHDNRYLYPGLYTGVVTSYTEDKKGEGWLTVKSPSFNIEKRIHESQLRRWLKPAVTQADVAA